MSDTEQAPTELESTPAPVTGATVSQIPEEALKARLDRERKSGEQKALEAVALKLGMDPDSAAKAIQEFNAYKDSQKSELQKLLDERDALKPRAAKADQLARRIAELSQIEFEALSEEQQQHVDDLSREGDDVDHEQRLKVIASLKRRGFAKPASEEKPKLPSTTTTSASGTGPKPTKEAEAGTPAYHLNQWEQMPQGVLKTAYYNDHFAAIDKARG